MAIETTKQIVSESPEVEAYKLALLNAAKGLTDQPINLPLQQIAGLSPLEREAMGLATSGIGAYMPYIQDALAAYKGSGEAITPEMIAQYQNPYQEALRQQIDRSFDQQLAQSNRGTANPFGGSAGAINQRMIGGQRAQQQALAEAQAYEAAGGMAQNEMARRAQAAGGIASLGGQLQSQNLQDINALTQLGGLERSNLQSMYDNAYKAQMAQLYEPYQRLSYLSDIYRGAPSTQQTITTASTPNVSPLQTALGLGISGLSAFAGAKEAGLFG
tara:strand:- start:790 stop:1608 length:819 start_codon:yes stop_codon:yes gene_type:complete